MITEVSKSKINDHCRNFLRIQEMITEVSIFEYNK